MEMNDEVFQKNVALLTQVTDAEARMLPDHEAQLPSVETLGEIVSLVKMMVFPGFFDKRQIDSDIRSYHIGVNMERLVCLLKQQISLALLFNQHDTQQAKKEGDRLTQQFIDRLPELKNMLYTDVEAVFADDPAARSYSEVIFSYPVILAMIHYRVAHELYEMGIPVIPRIITEQAHALTGIDIHPGARIGTHFSIDHGTGVVIGETSVIGNHVRLFQGVTLGAGHPDRPQPAGRNMVRLSVPRHPIIEDRVTVYSNSTLLGRITIGHDTVVGGNVWLTHSVPAGSLVLQGKSQDMSFSGGLGI